MDNNTKWYKKSIWIIALLILFFPAGLLLMWFYSNWNKKIKLGITGLFAFLILLGNIGGDNKKNTNSTVNGISTKTIATPTIEPTTVPSTPSPEPTITPYTIGTTATVKRAIDGDTIELDNGQRVRYIGIDTPEISQDECFASEALSKNKELVMGKEVKLEKDISEADKYSRLLRYVWIGNVLINDYLVREGYANASSYPPDIKYQDQFRLAEQEAREGNKGLWKGCGTKSTTKTNSPTTVQSSQQISGNCIIKGNISTTKEKIYHLPGCGSYTKTGVDISAGERWFCTEQEAVQAGWRKAKNC